ncbi:MAG: phosphate-starvation-inducible PsiE family protein [Candidatus Gracilibacteria bacterium]|nr:phosphate-starvation-inducible PsiE family protein [Candidatus Gracilibacteria bacterium]
MTQIKSNPHRLTVARYLRNSLNILITIIAILGILLMISEIYGIGLEVISVKSDGHEILKKIFLFFIYFEIVAMIVKYFEENYHFPFRYLLYIGATGTVRFLILEHTYMIEAATTIFILVVSYVILEYKNKKLGDKEKKPEWEEEEV